MSDINKNQRAFTIIELMIASVVFSVIILLVSTGVIRIGNSYYSGVLRARTQDTARNIIDEISRGIQFSGVGVISTRPVVATDPGYAAATNGSVYGFCVNNIGYSYVMDKKLANSTAGDTVRYGLIRYDSDCSTFVPVNVADLAFAGGLTNQRELLGIGMRLSDLNVVFDSTSNTATITVGIASGDDDLFNETGTAINKTCKSGAGSQFCAVSKLTTTVQKRI